MRNFLTPYSPTVWLSWSTVESGLLHGVVGRYRVMWVEVTECFAARLQHELSGLPAGQLGRIYGLSHLLTAIEIGGMSFRRRIGGIIREHPNLDFSLSYVVQVLTSPLRRTFGAFRPLV